MAGFQLEELLRAMEGEIWLPSSHRSIRRLSTDSRSIRRGDGFVPLRGETYDGHQFMAQALLKGAAGAIVEKSYRRKTLATAHRLKRLHPSLNPWIMGVDDSLRAYQNAAGQYRKRFQIPVVAVTGSNGKTTTKEMISHILRQRWTILKTKANFNNCVGVPQTLLRLTARHEGAVIEMGVDRKGQTTRLCELVQPTMGVITNIGPDHLEFFGTLKASAQGKAELLNALSPQGIIALNADDDFYSFLNRQASCRVISYGWSHKADLRASEMVTGRKGTTFRLLLPSRTRAIKIFIAAHGRHNVSNALAGAAIGYALGFSASQVARGLAEFKPAPMRSQIRRVQGMTFLYDCYNANPASMKAALAVLGDYGHTQRHIAVLGEMHELGKHAPRFHRVIGAVAAQQGLSHLVVCGGKLAACMAEGARKANMNIRGISKVPDVWAACRLLKTVLRRGDVVLLKGSRGAGMERIVEGMQA